MTESLILALFSFLFFDCSESQCFDYQPLDALCAVAARCPAS